MQYEDSFRAIRGQLWRRVERVPKRRWKTAVRPLMEAVNDAFEVILCIEEDPVHGTKTAAQIRYNRIVKAQHRIKMIEPPLWAFWDIAGDTNDNAIRMWKDHQKANFCEDMNEKVLKQLHDMQMGSTKYDPAKDMGITQLRYYTEDEIEEARFLTAMRELHRMTHGKVLRLSVIARDADGSLLLRFVDTAWYWAVHGNQCRLDVPAEREMRKQSFSRAISALYKAQRPLFNLFSIGSYSNQEIKEWTLLLNDATRLLLAVQASDKKR